MAGLIFRPSTHRQMVMSDTTEWFIHERIASVSVLLHNLGTIALIQIRWKILFVVIDDQIATYYSDVIMGAMASQTTSLTIDRLFRHRSKKNSKLRVTGHCRGNSPVTGEFPAQRASNAENVSIWWRYHDIFAHATREAQRLHLDRISGILMK